jgi:16S rRNA (guanine527-N7)-methyltransferase
VVMAMKGPSVADELAEAGDALAILGGGEIEVLPAYPEGDPMETVIVCVRKERATPAEYPRPPGVPRQSPLG